MVEMWAQVQGLREGVHCGDCGHVTPSTGSRVGCHLKTLDMLHQVQVLEGGHLGILDILFQVQPLGTCVIL